MVSSTEVLCCVAQLVESQGVISMGGTCIDSTKCLIPALEVAGIKAVNDQNAFDITTPENIDTCILAQG